MRDIRSELVRLGLKTQEDIDELEEMEWERAGFELKLKKERESQTDKKQPHQGNKSKKKRRKKKRKRLHDLSGRKEVERNEWEKLQKQRLAQ